MLGQCETYMKYIWRDPEMTLLLKGRSKCFEWTGNPMPIRTGIVHDKTKSNMTERSFVKLNLFGSVRWRVRVHPAHASQIPD